MEIIDAEKRLQKLVKKMKYCLEFENIILMIFYNGFKYQTKRHKSFFKLLF